MNNDNRWIEPIFSCDAEKRLFLHYLGLQCDRIRKEIKRLYDSGMTDNEVSRTLGKSYHPEWEDFKKKWIEEHVNRNID